MSNKTSHLLKRSSHFKAVLTGEGFLVGVVAGIVVLLYRVVLEYAGKGMEWVLGYVKTSPWIAGIWFFVLFILAYIVGKLVKFEPMISGSGIPQVEGEMMGKLDQVWWKVLPAKFLGGFLSLFSGLSLGREGPSIQIGAMAGKAVSKTLKRGKTEEKYLLTCGASAGLAAAFHAPLAGVMFSLEEIHKNFSVSVLISVMTASITADYISSQFMGFQPVFQFDIGLEVRPEYYWHIVILGILLGLLGAFYNRMTMWVQGLYMNNKKLNETTRLLIPFFLAGVLGLVMPQILGSGHHLIRPGGQRDHGTPNAAVSSGGEIFVFTNLFRLRGTRGNLFSAACSWVIDRRCLRYLCSSVFGPGCFLYQQFCAFGNGRIFHCYCESSNHRNYPDF